MTHLFSSVREWTLRHQLLLFVVVVSAVLHGLNMFGFPSYREDEGTYMSQARSVIDTQRLAPYTYWYDHAPAGWFLIAIFNIATGGITIAGLAVNSGRLYMLIIHVISTILVYKITERISGRRDAGVLAALLFSLSPLGIIFHRRVLLDNIMTCWLLLSLYFLTKDLKLRTVIGSALAFALAVLSKESALIFFPVWLFLVSSFAHRNNKLFAIVLWCSVAVLAISLYPLFAMLKGELFPSGTLLGGQQPHVSLFEAMRFQYNRGGEFLTDLLFAWETTWSRYGLVYIILGLVAVLINLFSYKKRWTFAMSLAVLLYILFMIRGQVLDWYIIPLIPLLALNIGLLWGDWATRLYFLTKHYRAIRFATFTSLLLFVSIELGVHRYIFTLQQTTNQVHALTWTRENIPSTDVLLIDNYAFVDLNPKVEDITQNTVHYYWKADTDPQIKQNVLHEDWNEIDYLLVTPALRRTIYTDNLTLVQQAFENSHIIKRFNAYDTLGEGYPVEIREVHNQQGSIQKSWRWYKDSFITADGRVVDRVHQDQTTSEAQSYALLRSVWAGDKETFDTVFGWTEEHMKLPERNLFVWLYGKNENGVYEVMDPATASDADEDIALSLTFAYQQWKDPQYLDKAKAILSDIWTHEVVKIGTLHYMTAGTHAKREEGYLINPSYFSPASYRIFAAVDQAHPWEQLAEDSYTILERQTVIPTTAGTIEVKLIPNWFIVTPTLDHVDAPAYVAEQGNLYGYDAFRLLWRVALDAEWHKELRARQYLETIAGFFKNEWETNKKIVAAYTQDGVRAVDFEDLSTYTGALSVFQVTDPELAIDVYTTEFWPQFTDGYWGDKDNYYNQNWVWFGTALYAHNVPNLWATRDIGSVARSNTQ